MSLSVYTTTGSCLYPEEGAYNPSIIDYEGSVVFLADLENQFNPTIEAKFNAELPNGVPKKLILRYEGDNPDTIFENCREAVLRELVEERDWTIQETEHPARVFKRTVLKPALDPSSILRETELEGHVDDLRALLGDDTELTLTCSDYEGIADVIRTFSDESITIAVTEDNRELSAHLKLHTESQASDVKLSQASRELLQSESTFEPSESRTESKDTSQTSTVVPSSETGESESGAGSPGGGMTPSDDVGDGDGKAADRQPTESDSGISTGVIFGVVALVIIGMLVGAGALMSGIFAENTGETPVEIQDASATLTDGDLTVVFNITEASVNESIIAAIFADGERLEFSRYDGGAGMMSIDNVTTIEAGDTIGVKATRGESIDDVNADEWQDSHTVTVAESAGSSLSVAITDVPSTVTSEDELSVEYRVENTGEESLTQDIELVVNGETRATHPEVQLSAGASRTDTFAVEVDSNWGPSATLMVRAGEEESDIRDINVQGPTLPVEIDTVTVRSVSPEQGRIVLTPTVTNVGEESITITGDVMNVELSGRSWIYSGSMFVIEPGETVTRDLLFATGSLESIEDSGTITIGTEVYVFDIPTNE